MAAPALYEIRVASILGESFLSLFEGFHVRYDENNQTVLTGPIVDQAALHGLLMRIRDLGLTLVAINRLEPEDGGES